MAKKARKKSKPAKVKKAKKKPLKTKAKKAFKKAKKAVAKAVKRVAAKVKKKKPVKAKKTKAKKKDVIGEGNYTAARNFREKETAYIRKNRSKIAEKAHEAEDALDGPEGAELEHAREETAAHGKE